MNRRDFLKRRITVCLTGLSLLLFFSQCGNGNVANERYAAAPQAVSGFEAKRSMSADMAQAKPGTNQLAVERKLIREGNMRFQTDNMNETRRYLDSLVAAVEGYVASENVYNYDGTIEQSLQVRIPSDKFDSFLATVSSFAGRLDSRYINTQDVTEEFIDIEARLSAKKELEVRYLELLKQARTVEDMVAIETQLSQVRSEIESIEGRLKYLQNRVSYASLGINFYQPKAEGFGFWDKVGDGWGNGWNKFLGFMVWLVTLWPFVLLIAILIAFVKIRKAKKRKQFD